MMWFKSVDTEEKRNYIHWSSATAVGSVGLLDYVPFFYLCYYFISCLTIDINKGFEYQSQQILFVRFIILRNIYRVLAVYFPSHILTGGGGHLIAFGRAGVFDGKVSKRGVAVLKTKIWRHALQSRLMAIVINVYSTKSAVLRTVTSTHNNEDNCCGSLPHGGNIVDANR
jgi:hypothetical protein